MTQRMMSTDQTGAEAGSDTSEQTKVGAISDYVCKTVTCTIQSQLGEITQQGRVWSQGAFVFVYRVRIVTNLSRRQTESVSPQITCY